MSNKLVNALLDKSNFAFTENGGLAYASSKHAVLDLFAIAGSARNLDEKVLESMFVAAFNEDFELSLRLVFWLGDIRGGAGERRAFKLALKMLALRYPNVLDTVLSLVPEYTRWDYLYELVGTPCEDTAAVVFANEVHDVISNKKSSLIFKWLKSANTSSEESRRLAQWTMIHVFGYKPSLKSKLAYIKLLSKQRAKLGDAVVERKLSSRKFELIDYANVPSKAHLKYANAFKKHDQLRYSKYLDDVSAGTANYNASVLFPYDIIHQYNRKTTITKNLEVAWDNLAQYVDGSISALSIGDFSMSMNHTISKNSDVTAYEVACGMGIYLSQGLSGPFKDKMMIFSNNARLLDLSRYTTIYDKLAYLDRHREVAGTNIEAVFDLVLQTAVDNKIAQEEMPSLLIFFTDTEFDGIVDDSHTIITTIDSITQKYAAAGYTRPTVVFWNLCARHVQFTAKEDSTGFMMVSGYSPALLRQVLSGKYLTPLDLMLATLMTPRYDKVIEVLRGA